MSKNTSSTTTAAKKVTKKSETAAVEAKPVAAVAAPVAEAKPAAKKAAAKPAVAPGAAAAPVEPAPVASSVQAEAAVETTTVDQEIASLITSLQSQRDQAVAAIKTLQRLQKRVAKEVKEAGRRRRRVKQADENGAPKEKRPTIFTTPVTLSENLCSFLSKPKGTQMTPADVTRAFSAYVEAHKLKDANKGHTIHPDAAMRKVLGISEGEEVSYRNVQKYLYKQYILPEKKKVATQ